MHNICNTCGHFGTSVCRTFDCGESRERERAVRRMCPHKEENTHAQFAQNLRMPNLSHRDRKELENKQMISQKFTNSLNHSIASWMTLTLKMLTVSLVSFTSSTHSLSETGLNSTWSNDCAREFPHLLYPRVPPVPNHECPHRAFQASSHSDHQVFRKKPQQPSVYPQALAELAAFAPRN